MLTFPVEVFKALAQARVQRLLQVLLITLGKGFFALFPEGKSAGQGPHSGSELSADFNPSTLGAHQMPPEQLVDVPVPQVHERSSRSLLHEKGKSLLEGLHRRQEAEGGVSRLPFWKRRRWMRTRMRKRLWSRGSFLTSVLVAGAGTCLLAASALMDGSALLHTMSLSFIQTHGSAMWLRVTGLVQGLGIPWTLPGCPCRFSGAGKCTGGTGSGAWHPLTPSWVPVRGASAPQIMEAVEVVQHVPTAGELIVVCQCHRSCRYVEVASLYGVLPQAQFLDKVVDMPVASMTGAWGRQCRKLRHSQLQC